MAVVWKGAERLMTVRDAPHRHQRLQGNEDTHWEGNAKRLTDTDELGALVQYPEEGTDATDHLRPSALQTQNSNRLLSGSSPVHMKPTHPDDSLRSSNLRLIPCRYHFIQDWPCRSNSITTNARNCVKRNKKHKIVVFLPFSACQLAAQMPKWGRPKWRRSRRKKRKSGRRRHKAREKINTVNWCRLKQS